MTQAADLVLSGPGTNWEVWTLNPCTLARSAKARHTVWPHASNTRGQVRRSSASSGSRVTPFPGIFSLSLRLFDVRVELPQLCAANTVLRGSELLEQLSPFDATIFAALESILAFEGADAGRCRGRYTACSWCDVQVPDGADGIETVLQCCESAGLWEEHEQAIHALVKMRIALWLEELHAEVGEYGRFEELDKLVDLNECVDGHFHVGKGL